MAPFKCPDCGIWWAGLEHRCLPPTTVSRTTNWPPFTGTGSVTVRCTCPEKRGDNYLGSCLVHDVVIFW